MQIYHVTRNPDVYDALYCNDDSEYRLILRFFGYYPYHQDKSPKVWKPITVKIDPRHKKGDFPSLCPFLVFSSRARKVLQPLIGNYVEFLPLKLEGDLEQYAIIKIKQRTDCLDYSRAEVKRFSHSGRVMRVLKFAFKKGSLNNKNFFNIPEETAGIFVSDKFKNCVEDNNLEGLIFREVYSD